jgi:two-component system sensor histidine kinase/response regulator
MPEAVKLLLVDDMPQNLVALDALLARPGVTLLQARSGGEALELLLKHDVALALVDVQMPGMDGFELAELMRGSPRTRHVPIIFLTATDRSAHRTFRGYEAGAVDFLYKPLDPHILRGKVDVFVQLQVQRLQLAAQLETQQQLLKTNEMFVAVLGHDLRNPLSSVMMSADLLIHTHTDEKVRHAATRIRASSERMARMVDQLLDVAQMRAGRMKLAPVAADLALVCAGIVEEFQPRADGARLVLETHGDTRGYWDVDRLSQVLSNLVGNALHHGDPAHPVAVRVDGSSPGAVRVRVRNAGALSPDVAAGMFTPFQPGMQRRSGNSGLGLGLYIARALVDMHGGCIDVQSCEAKGTVFEVTLPKVPSTAAAGDD